jgi:hypothetical protein
LQKPAASLPCPLPSCYLAPLIPRLDTTYGWLGLVLVGRTLRPFQPRTITETFSFGGQGKEFVYVYHKPGKVPRDVGFLSFRFYFILLPVSSSKTVYAFLDLHFFFLPSPYGGDIVGVSFGPRKEHQVLRMERREVVRGQAMGMPWIGRHQRENGDALSAVKQRKEGVQRPATARRTDGVSVTTCLRRHDRVGF